MRALLVTTSLTLLAAATAVTPAHAQTGAKDPASAEGLFDRGHKLLDDPSKLDEACQVLAQSYALAERGDALLNLAECHRRQGKTATAWAEFDKAIPVGAKVGFTRAMQIAAQLRDELALKLSLITVTVTPETAALEGLTVQLDGKPLPQDQWNKALVHDPGPLEVTATAKGRLPFSGKVALGNDRDRKTVTLALELVPPPVVPPKPPPPPPPPPPKPVPQRSKPIWQGVVGGLGLGLVGAAVGFAVDQHAAGGQLDTKCGPQRTACPQGFDFGPLRSRELRDFRLFVGLGAAGLVSIGSAGVGLGLWSRRPPADVALDIGPSSLSLHGGF